MREYLDLNNPSAFRNPFIKLAVERKDGTPGIMIIDVDAQIHLYFIPGRPEVVDLRLLGLCRFLASRGVKVLTFCENNGQDVPTHILRSGVLYGRVVERELTKDPDPNGLKVKFEPPRYDSRL